MKTKHKSRQSVAIIYGWAEGFGHGVGLRRELRRAGLTKSRSAAKADIIITHSAGSLLLPRAIKAELVLMVGVPYWPGKNPAKGLKEKLHLEFRNPVGLVHWLRKTFYNSLYSLKPRHQHSIMSVWNKPYYPASSSCSFIAVRNRHDPFMHPDKIVALGAEKSWSLVSLPGQHDDLWLNPKRYVDILKQYLG